MLSTTVIATLIIAIILFIIGHFTKVKLLKFVSFIGIVLGVWMVIAEVLTDTSF